MEIPPPTANKRFVGDIIPLVLGITDSANDYPISEEYTEFRAKRRQVFADSGRIEYIKAIRL
jgi:hypothetical protein